MAISPIMEFILQHRNDDVRKLALQASKHPDIDFRMALEQIAGWQAARVKLPSWAECDGVVFPPHISMEQCSSEHTALYKQSIARRLFADAGSAFHGKFMDITGGFGVDFSFMAQAFKEATYVERQQHLCDIAHNNFTVLGLSNAKVVCGDGVEYLQDCDNVDFLYLDPARRDNTGGRTYAIEDCTPNVIAIKDLLLSKAACVMVKLSPMLDWHKAVRDIGDVSEVHIVSVKNECKELLVVMQRGFLKTKVFCVNDNDEEVFFLDDKYQELLADEDVILPTYYLYEPNASLMKGGELGILSEEYNVKKIGSHSNLFISAELVDFPGRRFHIEAITTMNKKELRASLSGITKANIATRNFPLTPEELRKRLKLKDGGNTYIFATTDTLDRHILLICRKV